MANSQLHISLNHNTAATGRARSLSAPEELIQSAFFASEENYPSEEKAIFAWCAEKWTIDEDAVIRVLNGLSSIGREKGHRH